MRGPDGSGASSPAAVRFGVGDDGADLPYGERATLGAINAGGRVAVRFSYGFSYYPLASPASPRPVLLEGEEQSEDQPPPAPHSPAATSPAALVESVISRASPHEQVGGSGVIALPLLAGGARRP